MSKGGGQGLQGRVEPVHPVRHFLMQKQLQPGRSPPQQLKYRLLLFRNPLDLHGDYAEGLAVANEGIGNHQAGVLPVRARRSLIADHRSLPGHGEPGGVH